MSVRRFIHRTSHSSQSSFRAALQPSSQDSAKEMSAPSAYHAARILHHGDSPYQEAERLGSGESKRELNHCVGKQNAASMMLTGLNVYDAKRGLANRCTLFKRLSEREGEVLRLAGLP